MDCESHAPLSTNNMKAKNLRIGNLIALVYKDGTVKEEVYYALTGEELTPKK